jgi:hypothetical protein
MKSPGSHRILKRLVSVWTALFATYFMWEALTYRGLFARLAEFQIAKFGAYAPLLTYLVLVAILVVPALIILWFVTRSTSNDADPDSERVLRIGQARRIRAVLAVVGVTVLAVALGFAVFAGWFLPGQSGKLQTIAISDVGTVEITEGPARLVGGELGTIVYFGQDWFIGEERMAFAPYRPSGGSDGLARVFVELDAKNRAELKAMAQRPAWSGIIVEGALPGTARALFSYIGVGVATPHYTLYRTEYDLKVRYWLQAVQWAMLAGFIGLLVLLQSRKIRRLEKDQAPIAT